MLRVVKMLLKEEVGGSALYRHGNYIADHGKSWKIHGIVVLNFCGDPDPKQMFKLWVRCCLKFYAQLFCIIKIYVLFHCIYRRAMLLRLGI